MKNLLKERFQQLAGIKPLYEEETVDEFAACVSDCVVDELDSGAYDFNINSPNFDQNFADLSCACIGPCDGDFDEYDCSEQSISPFNPQLTNTIQQYVDRSIKNKKPDPSKQPTQTRKRI